MNFNKSAVSIVVLSAFASLNVVAETPSVNDLPQIHSVDVKTASTGNKAYRNGLQQVAVILDVNGDDEVFDDLRIENIVDKRTGRSVAADFNIDFSADPNKYSKKILQSHELTSTNFNLTPYAYPNMSGNGFVKELYFSFESEAASQYDLCFQFSYYNRHGFYDTCSKSGGSVLIDTYAPVSLSNDIYLESVTHDDAKGHDAISYGLYADDIMTANKVLVKSTSAGTLYGSSRPLRHNEAHLMLNQIGDSGGSQLGAWFFHNGVTNYTFISGHSGGEIKIPHSQNYDQSKKDNLLSHLVTVEYHKQAFLSSNVGTCMTPNTGRRVCYEYGEHKGYGYDQNYPKTPNARSSVEYRIADIYGTMSTFLIKIHDGQAEVISKH